MLTRASDCPVDPVHGRFIEGLTPERMAPILRQKLGLPASPQCGSGSHPGIATCRVVEALYDPGEQLRIAYVLFDNDNTDPKRAWPDGDLCYVRFPVRETVSRRGTSLSMDGLDFEVYSFPNDRRLRGLRKFARRDRAATTWQRWLSEDEPGLDLQPDTLRRSLLRYVPEQKWIVHLHARCHDGVAGGEVKRAIAVRSASVAACQRIYARVVALRRARKHTEGLYRVPKPVAFDSDLGMLALRWAWGASLIQLLDTNDPAAVMGHVTTGLHALHATTIEGLKPWTTEDALDSAVTAANDLGAVAPDLRETLKSLIEQLTRSAPPAPTGPPRTLHGDFYWNQLRGRADRLTVLDLERCALGDPLVDVAMFATQISMLSERPEFDISREQASAWNHAFLHAWEQTTGASINAEAFRWYAAVALLTLARGAMRHLRPNWPATVDRYVSLAADAASNRDDLEILV